MLTRVPCPICRRETPPHGNPYRPFCSERCRIIDLGNWASERYRVPGPAIQAEPESDTDDEDGD